MHRGSILLAEDETILAMVIQTFLEDEGFQVEHVPNGEVAWQRLQQEPAPNLIITDLCMPRLGGMGLIESVSGHTTLSRIPVIVITASVVQESPQAYCWLRKPFSLLDLLDTVKGAMAEPSSVAGA